ncbi:DUF3347 domain-containing protein [Myroides sp. LoEW2-1]|uniref:DUF3347 domain-containing protein n=1 Tax=Myroides sp. LoEW2-1 TaxID=2683192 RepID=UPI00132067DA|nr:DUF3347 domain-containing protein [Myroides sp. LoEW2-1]MVX34625.1 DUF3347 domain-containing protein [Myroides sp. LoEW2-1]
MKKVIFTVAILAISFASCNDKNKKEDHTGDDHKTEQTTTDANHHHVADTTENEGTAIKQSATLSPILNAYFEMKKALQEDNLESATKASEKLVTAIEVTQSLLKEDADKELLAKIETDAKELVAGDIKVKRAHFETLSHNLKALIKSVGSDRVVYQQYCPMYEQKGGMWLSDEKDLKNPLFGASMLKCGMTQETFNPEA